MHGKRLYVTMMIVNMVHVYTSINNRVYILHVCIFIALILSKYFDACDMRIYTDTCIHICVCFYTQGYIQNYSLNIISNIILI